MTKQILLIDDEPDFTELAKTLLGFHGFSVDVFNNPAQVEAAAAKTQYDLVVTDLMMPGIDGFAIVQNLRGQKGYQNIPLIVLSAKTLTDEERKQLLASEVHFLTKPFDPQGLVDQIKRLLGQS